MPDENRGVIKSIVKWVYAALFFLLPWWFSFFRENLSVFELNKQLLFKLLLGGLLVLLFILVIRSGKVKLLESRWIYWLWLLFLPLLAINVWQAIDPANTFFGRYGREQGVLIFLHYWLFFGVSLFLLPYIRDKKAIWLSMLWGSVPVMLYGYLQYFKLDPIPWVTEDRIFSTLGQPNFYGYYLVFIIPLAAYAVLFCLRQRWSRALGWIVVLSQVVSLFLTLSRGAMVGLGVAVTFLFFIWAWKKFGWRIAGPIFLAAVILLSVLWSNRNAIVSSFDLSRAPYIINRVVSIIDLESPTIKARLTYWQAGYEIFLELPTRAKLLGIGKSNQFHVYYSQYEPDWVSFEKMALLPDRTHNILLDLLLEFGIVGLLFFTVFNLYIVFLAFNFLARVKNSRNFWGLSVLLSAVVGYFVMNLFAFSMTTHFIYYYFILAVIVSASGKIKEKPVRLSRVFLWLIFISLMFLYCLVFYLFSVKYYAMDIKNTYAFFAKEQQDCTTALKYGREAVQGYGYSRKFVMEYLDSAGLCTSHLLTDEQLNKIANNVETFSGMVDGHLYRQKVLVEYYQVYTQLGRYLDEKYYDKAEEYLNYLLDLNPNFLYIYRDYARMKIWQGEYDEALRIIDSAFEVLPDLPPDHFRYHEVQSEKALLHKIRADALYNKKEFVNSLAEYDLALNLGGVIIATFRDAADVAVQLGELDLAISYLEKGLSYDSNNPLWSQYLSKIYKQKGEKKKADYYEQMSEDLEEKLPNN